MPTYSLGCGLFQYGVDNSWDGDPIAALEAAAEVGFRQVEVMCEGAWWQQPTAQDIRNLRGALDRLGIFAHTLHTPFVTTNLASPHEASRRRAIERVAAAMRHHAELGGRTVIVHASAMTADDEPDYELTNFGSWVEWSYRSITDLVKVAEETRVRIAVENLGNTILAHRPFVSMRELRCFIADFPPEHVGLCLDTGHACISGLDPAEQARIASERLFALHLQDVDGRRDCHWLPGRGVIDWTQLGAAIDEIDYDGAWTLELLAPGAESSADVARAAGRLRDHWEAAGMTNPATSDTARSS